MVAGMEWVALNPQLFLQQIGGRKIPRWAAISCNFRSELVGKHRQAITKKVLYWPTLRNVAAFRSSLLDSLDAERNEMKQFRAIEAQSRCMYDYCVVVDGWSEIFHRKSRESKAIPAPAGIYSRPNGAIWGLKGWASQSSVISYSPKSNSSNAPLPTPWDNSGENPRTISPVQAEASGFWACLCCWCSWYRAALAPLDVKGVIG